MSKSFDNGMICASEQSVIVDREIKDDFERLMKEAGCYFLTEEETNRLRDTMFLKKRWCVKLCNSWTIPIQNSWRSRNRGTKGYKSISTKRKWSGNRISIF